MNLVRMPEDDVLTEDDVAPARAEQQRIQRLSKHEAQRASPRLCDRHHDLVLEQRSETRTSDDQRGVLLAARRSRRK